MVVKEEYSKENYCKFKLRDEYRDNLRNIEEKLDKKKNSSRDLAYLVEEKEKVEAALLDLRNEIVTKNLGIVRSLSLKMAKSTSRESDLYFSDGCLGLMKAAEKYELSYNVTFSTYAYYWILAYINRSYHKEGHLIKLNRHSNRFKSKLPFEFNLKEYYDIAKQSGLSENQAECLIPFLSEPLSLEAPVHNDKYSIGGNITLKDRIVKDGSLTQEELLFLKEKEIFLEGIEEWMNKAALSPIQKEILKELYGISNRKLESKVKRKTKKFIANRDRFAVEGLQEVANKIYENGLTDHVLSRQRIQQIKDSALKKMRQNPLSEAAEFL